MQSKALTVSKYLAELPADRRAAIEAVRKVILENLDEDYAEGMCYGMIGYSVPLSIYPAGYHCNPEQGLTFAALASQKNYMSLYMMGVYCGCVPGELSVQEAEANRRRFEEAWAKSGKKLDMGKSCIRFKKVEDLALDVLGEAIRRLPARKYIEFYEASLARKSVPRAEIKKAVAARKAAKPKKAAKKKLAKAVKKGPKKAKKKAAKKSRAR
jgi:hypothetical protein